MRSVSIFPFADPDIPRSHPGTVLTRERFDDSTANLVRHVKSCDPADASQRIVSFTAGSTYSGPKFRYLAAMWCARRHRPFSIIEDPELVEMFQMLYGRIQLLSRVTLSRDVREIFILTCENVVKILQVCFSTLRYSFHTLTRTRNTTGKSILESTGGRRPTSFHFLGSQPIVV